MRPARQTWNSAHYGAGGTNSANTVTLAAPGAGKVWVIGGITWSYQVSDPTAGSISVTAGATLVLSQDITAKGAGYNLINIPRAAPENTAVAITLAAGGAGVTSKLWVDAWVEDLTELPQ